jgi:uncharacterized cupredoxin-like copper-binding protein
MSYPMRALVTSVLIGLTSSCASPGVVGVTLDEFSLQASPSRTDTAAVTFRVRNIGQIAHEFVVLRTDRPAHRLPVRRQEVDTSASGIRVVRALRPVRPGATMTVGLRLDPGRYTLICNVPAHYSSGMRAAFTVVGGVAPGS